VSLRARLTLFVALAVGGAVAAVAFFSYGFAQNEARAEVDRFLQERGPVVGLLGVLDIELLRVQRPPGLGPGGGGGAGQGQGSGADRDDTLGDVIRADAVAQFVDSAGGVIAFGDAGVVLPVDQADIDRADGPLEDLIRDVSIDDVHYRMLTRHIGPGLAIQVARDVSGTDEILAGLRLRLLLLGLGGVALAAAVGWFVSNRSLRPVAALTAAAADVAETQNLDARIAVSHGDELGQLAGSFNRMLAALAEARHSQQRLVADASHELRTPLTSLRTNIELLEKGVVTGTDREELLADVGSELVELTHLVGELVDLATIGRHEEPRIEVDLAEVVEQAAARLHRRSEATIVVETEPTHLEGRPGSLLRAVSNLLENAAKWGTDHGTIEVSLRDGVLKVRDHGPGIPEEDLSRIFERFYRSPAARSLPGSGLGLSIVAAVAEEHDATVFAENAPDGGAIVGLRLPTSEA
jgi:two-component system sensor histidine kinase MprB